MTRPHLRLEATAIGGMFVLHRTPLRDDRGSFERMFCAAELAEAGFSAGAVQVNRSRTDAAGTVRGLHYQGPGGPEVKLVSCLRGAVHDVAVDVRRGSPTFGLCVAVQIQEDGHEAVLLPAGVAHGFQALTQDSELLYIHSSAYDPALDIGVSAVDPRVGIAWPLDVKGLSARDVAWPPLADIRPWSAQP